MWSGEFAGKKARGGGGGAAIIRFAVTAPLERFRFRVERGVCSLKQAGVGGAQPPHLQSFQITHGMHDQFYFFSLVSCGVGSCLQSIKSGGGGGRVCSASKSLMMNFIFLAFNPL